jgi:hypothetical protein
LPNVAPVVPIRTWRTADSPFGCPSPLSRVCVESCLR